MRLLFLIPFLLVLPNKAARSRARARLALSLVMLATKIDAVVVILTAQQITTMTEATIVNSMLDEIDKEQKKIWPKSSLN